MSFSKNPRINPEEKAVTVPSSKGITGGGASSSRIDQPYRQIGMPPRDTTGSPSMSFDVNASEIMQNKIMNQDDKDWYKELQKIMADDFLEPRFTVNHASPGKAGLRAEPSMDTALNAGVSAKSVIKMQNNSIRNFISFLLENENLVTEPDDVTKKDKKRKRKRKKENEVNAIGAGNIAGYTAPLSSATKKKRKENAKINARAFGNGSVKGKI